MFYGETLNDTINSVHKRELRALYNDFTSNYHELLNRGNLFMIHKENKRHLLIEVFKCIKVENPPLLNGLFTRKENLNNLRINDIGSS